MTDAEREAVVHEAVKAACANCKIKWGATALLELLKLLGYGSAAVVLAKIMGI